MASFSKFVQQTIKKDTGYHESVVQDIWEKYQAFGSAPGTFGGQLPRPKREAWKQQAYFYCYLIWVHKGLDPEWKEAWHLPKLQNEFTMSARTFRNRVLPIGDALAEIIDEVDYSRRLSPWNHAPWFKYFVTGMVDTFPVFVPTPNSYSLAQLLYQPKYKRCVLKIQIGCNFLGEIILWTGPNLGIDSDVTIWDTTWQDHPMLPWEMWLADLGYVGGRGLLYKYKKRARRRNQPPPPALRDHEVVFNNIHEHVRNRIENVISKVKVPPPPSPPSPRPTPTISPPPFLAHLLPW